MKRPVIGMAFAPLIPDVKYERYADIIRKAGGEPVKLPLIRSEDVRYDAAGHIAEDQFASADMLKPEIAGAIKARNFARTTVEAAMAGIDGVYMPGGNDVTPCLLSVPEAVDNAGEKIEVDRDISDYILAAYCVERDIPLLAVCHGEQILGVAEGCALVQDMNKAYSREVYLAHRMPPEMEKRDYTRGDVLITDPDSVIGRAANGDVIPNAALWHHQCLGSVEGTGLRVTAVTRVNDTEIIQAVERPDLRFCVGLQFHPEIDCGADLDTSEKVRCDENICREFFRQLVIAAEK